jgi:hypothetical protein
VLHNNEPAAVVDNIELPQLLAAVTPGAEGTVKGEPEPLPVALQPLPLVVVTLYVFPSVTVIEEVVAPVLQDNVPPAVVDSVELPQALAADTPGVEGTVKGEPEPLPVTLHPLPLVVVTLYVFPSVTVIEEVVAPVLQDNVAPAVVDSVELPQALAADTPGVEGTVKGEPEPLPVALQPPVTVIVTL